MRNRFCGRCELSAICLPIGATAMADKLEIYTCGSIRYNGNLVECCADVALRGKFKVHTYTLKDDGFGLSMGAKVGGVSGVVTEIHGDGKWSVNSNGDAFQIGDVVVPVTNGDDDGK